MLLLPGRISEEYRAVYAPIRLGIEFVCALKSIFTVSVGYLSSKGNIVA